MEATTCQFVLGFADLRNRLGSEAVGECVEDEHYDDLTEKSIQRTTRGELVWSKQENATSFTIKQPISPPVAAALTNGTESARAPDKAVGAVDASSPKRESATIASVAALSAQGRNESTSASSAKPPTAGPTPTALANSAATPPPTVTPLPSDTRTVTIVRGGRQFQTKVLAEERAPDGSPMRAGSIVVKFRPGTATTTQSQSHALAGALSVDQLSLPLHSRVAVQQDAVAATLARYRARPDVEFAEADYIVRANVIPSDPLFPQQWGMNRINAPAAWDRTQSSSSVRIAILDCGIFSSSSIFTGPDGLPGHPDIRSKVVLEQNFSTSTLGPDDFCNHGTHVAGIAAASTNNGVGVAGAGFNASIMNGKILDDSGSTSASIAANGIVWAANNGARVINLSIGAAGPCSSTLQSAIDFAWSHGAVLVAAAGNNGVLGAEQPANCNGVISVGATTQSDARASFSNYGSNVDVAAPGISILSTDYIGSYRALDGTSMAAPHVAGLAALVWSTEFGTSNQAVVNRILNTSDAVPGTGTYWTFGRINAANAVTPSVPMFTLSTARAGNGSGLITSSPAGINCGSVCSAGYPSGTQVTLNAAANAGSTFVGWTGACSGQSSCSVTMNASQSVTATFALAAVCSPRPPVAVSVTPLGSGRIQVTLTPAVGNNVSIASIQFGAATNALIDIQSTIGATGNFTVTLPAGTQQTTFVVRRAASGVAMTVPLTVVDSCGSWPTFVGAGTAIP